MTNEQPKEVNVPVTAHNKIKVIIQDTAENLEDATNLFMESVSASRRVTNITFSVNPKTGDLINIIHYTDMTAITEEEWTKRNEIQKELSSGFRPNLPTPNKITSL